MISQEEGLHLKQFINHLIVAASVLCALAYRMTAGEVARVGDQIVSSEAVRQTVARNGYNIFDPASVKKGLDDAVQFELLAAEAKKLGLDKEPVVARQIKELLVQKLLEEKVDAQLVGLHFSDSELKSYYEAHANDFRRPALAKGYVLTLLNTSGREAETHAKMAEALQGWKLSKKLDAVVKQYTDDPSERTSGGLSDYFVEGRPGRRYPLDVEEAMLALKLRGDVAGPILTPRAWYFVALIERRDAQPTPFEQARADIHKRLVRERRAKLLADYCDSLKKEFPVTINEAQLKAVAEASKLGAGPPPLPVETP